MASSSGGTTFVSSSSKGTKMDENVIARLSLRQNSAACAAAFPENDRPMDTDSVLHIGRCNDDRVFGIKDEDRFSHVDANADQQVHRVPAERKSGMRSE